MKKNEGKVKNRQIEDFEKIRKLNQQIYTPMFFPSSKTKIKLNQNIK
jgi:hypothetical protein